MKLVEYMSKFLLEKQINQIFMVTGGFAMFMNDTLHENFNVIYNHHEQASVYSAIGYVKQTDKMCIVETTSGCGITNTITGILSAWQDSIPILFLAGQVKSQDTIKYYRENHDLKLRNICGSDSDITDMVKNITKYCYEINDKNSIRYHLSKAIYMANEGRKGPVLLSIPVDLQGNVIDENLFVEEFVPKSLELKYDIKENILNDLLSKSKRPIILAGNGIKTSESQDLFYNFIKKYNLPVVFTFFTIDLFDSNDELYIGRIGILGERCGNFAIQNSDLIISMGCRLSKNHVGYNAQWFGREAKIVVVDIDQEEHSKNIINIDHFIHSDVNYFLNNFNIKNNLNFENWVSKCNHWKKKWLFNIPEKITDEYNRINPYYVVRRISELNKNNKTSYIANAGTLCPISYHVLKNKIGDKYIICHQGDMGFELPGSIGVYTGSESKNVIVLVGDGSVHFNIQELQTIKFNKLSIKIIIFNNNGYCCIRNTQKNYFNKIVGCDSESGLSLPDYEKIANAYEIGYIKINNLESFDDKINDLLSRNEPTICEIMVMDEDRYPKLGAKKQKDGTFKGKPFEDMAPFLDREEFYNEMIIKPLD